MCFFFIVTLQVAFQCFARLLTIAVVRLIVDDHDVLQAHQVGHDALKHLSFSLNRLQRLFTPAFQCGSRSLRDVRSFAKLEGVVVRDDDLGPVEVGQHVVRDQLAALIIAVRVIRLQDSQAISNSDSWCDDQESPRELSTVRTSNRVDRLPRDQHGHHGRLAGSCRELQRDPHQFGIRLLVRRKDMVQELLADLSCFRCYFRKPDGRLGSFDLTEEWAKAAELVMSPMLQQPGRLRRHVPVIWIRECSPLFDMLSNLIDDRRRVVLLLFGRESFAFIEDEFFVFVGLLFLTFFGLWDRRNEFGPSPSRDDLLRWLPGLIQLPVLRGIAIRRIEDGLVKEAILHEVPALHCFPSRGRIGSLMTNEIRSTEPQWSDRSFQRIWTD